MDNICFYFEFYLMIIDKKEKLTNFRLQFSYLVRIFLFIIISIFVKHFIINDNFIDFQDFNIFLGKIITHDVDLGTNYSQDVFKNIHFQLMDVVSYKKHPKDYKSLIPQILYQTFYLGQQNILEDKCKIKEEDKLILPIKIFEEINEIGINVVHFLSIDKKCILPSEKYDQYCLQIHIGAVKCLKFEKQINYINNSIESICDLCFHHSEVNLEALKHLTECISFITKEQWKISSKFIYKILMGQMNHHLPSIYDQCILLFNKCMDLEDFDYILKIIMTEISWSLRIKFYMLSVIASKYGVKKASIFCVLNSNLSFYIIIYYDFRF